MLLIDLRGRVGAGGGGGWMGSKICVKMSINTNLPTVQCALMHILFGKGLVVHCLGHVR